MLTLIEWRNGLEWVPVVVFFLLIFLPIIIGAFSGWRRSLFWGGGILTMYCIGWLLTAFLAPNIPVEFYKTIITKIGMDISDMSNDLIVKVGVSIAGIVFFVICTFVGTLIIVLPNYYIWGKKVLKIGKYSIPKEKYYEIKDTAKEKCVSKRALIAEYKQEVKEQKQIGKGRIFGAHLAGLAIMGATFFPVCTATTELTYAATCRYTKDNSFASNLGTFCESTNQYLSYKYTNFSYENVNSCISFVQLLYVKDNEGYSLFRTYIQTFAKALNNIKILISQSAKVTANIMNTIKLQIISVSDYLATEFTGSTETYGDVIAGYINEMGNSRFYKNLFTELVASKYKHAGVTWEQFLNINSFLNIIQSNTTINVFQYEDERDFHFSDYAVDGWMWGKLKLNNDGYQLIRETIKYLNFDTSTFEPENLEIATNIMTNFFAENTEVEPATKKIAEINDIDTMINYDKWFVQIGDFPNFKQAKKLLLAANGTEEHPYIIPADMYWTIPPGGTVQANTDFFDIGNMLHWNLFPDFTPIDANHNFTFGISPNFTDIEGLKVQVNNNKKLISFGHSDTTPSMDVFNTNQPFSFTITCTDSISELTYSTTKYFEFRSFLSLV